MHLSKASVVLLVLLYAGGALSAPQTQQQPPLPRTLQRPGQSDTGPSIPPQFEKEMQRKANDQRQAELKRDTEKLLKLSTELKDYVDKTDANVLSMDVIKKAEEIEKLARSVRMKMRGSD
ncbi:MAG: hypothetical protein JO356_03540 [Acidobacteria bacterium]|nr:hypothetical protein [Acidobacteriota bacterium]